MAKDNVIKVRIDGKGAGKGADVVARSLDRMSQKTKETKQSIASFSGATKKQQQSLANLSKAAEKTSTSFSGLASKFQSLVLAASGFSTFKKIVTVGAQFEAQMTRVGVISGSTAEELAKLTKSARHFGSTTQFSATEAGKAMEYLALSGMSTSQIIGSMGGLLGLAAASGEDLATIADIISDQLSALGMHAGETGRMADSMAFAMSHANTNVSMLGQGMSYASPVMKTAQQSMESVITALSLMSNVGIKSTRAGTAVRMGMLRLVGPAKRGEKALKLFGIKVNDSAGDVRDLADILQDLNKATEKTTAGTKLSKLKDMFGVEALPGMIELVKQSKVGTQTIDILGEKVSITTTKFKSFRLGVRLAQSEGKMLIQAMQLTGTEFKNVEGFVGDYDKALKKEISTGQTLRAAFLDQGNASHELVAALAVLDSQGIKTGQSTKMLSGFVEEMIMPGEKATKVFDKISASVGKPFDEIQDFSQIVSHLGKVTADMSEKERMATYLSLVGDSGIKGAEALSKLVKESQQLETVGENMSKVTGTSQEMAEKMTKNLVGSWKTLGSTIEELWITIFGDIGGPLDTLTKKATGFVRGFTAIWPQISAGIGLVLSPLQMLISWIGQAMNYFSALNSLADGLTITEKLRGLIQILYDFDWSSIDWSGAGKALINTFIDGIISTGKSIYDAVLSAFKWVASLLPHSNADQGPLARIYEAGVAFITTIIDGIVSAGSALFTTVSNIFKPILSAIGESDWFLSGKKALSNFGEGILSVIPHIYGPLIAGFAAVIVQMLKITAPIKSVSKAITTPFKLVLNTVKVVIPSFQTLTKIIALPFKLAAQALRILVPIIHISIVSISAFSNASLLILNIATHIRKLIKVFGALGIAVLFVYKFHKELTAIASSLMALDFAGASENFNKLFASVGQSWNDTWAKAKETFEGTFIGGLMLGAENAASYLKSIWGDFAPDFSDLGKSLVALDFSGVTESLTNIFTRAFVGISNLWNSTWIKAKETFQGTFVGDIMNSWDVMHQQYRSVIKGITGSLAAIGLIATKLSFKTVLLTFNDIGKAIGNFTPLGRGALFVFGLISKVFILWNQYPEQINSIIDAIKSGFNFLREKFTNFLVDIQKIFDSLNLPISAFALAIESVSLFLLPFPKLLKVVIASIALFDLLALKIGFSSEKARTIALSIGAFVSVLGMAVLGNPFIALLAGIAFALFAFRHEIISAITSIAGFWDSFSEAYPMAANVLKFTGIVLTAIGLVAAGFISVPLLIIGAVGGVIAAFGMFHEIVNFIDWDNIGAGWKIGILLLGAVVTAALGMVLRKAFQDIGAEKKAKACLKNPLMACMLPDQRDTKRWNAFKKDIKEGKHGLALMSNKMDCGKGGIGQCMTSAANQATKANQMIGSQTRNTYASIQEAAARTEKNITSASQRLESDSKNTAKKTSGIWKTATGSIGNAFKSMWTGVVNQSKNAVGKFKGYVEDAKFTGSGVTDGRSKEVIGQAQRLADRSGVSRYQKSTSTRNRGKETEEFKELKKVAQAQATTFRSLMQQIVVGLANSMQTMSTKASNAIKQTSQGMSNVWQKMRSGADTSFDAIKQKSDSTFNAMKQKANDYSNFAQNSNQQFATPSAAPKMSGSGFSKGTTQALQQQQSLVKELGAAHTSTATQTGAAYDSMGQKAGGYTDKLRNVKIGIAGLAIGGALIAFSSSANAASSELDNVQQKTSLLEQATKKLSAAWTWLTNNLETVGMGAFMFLTSGIVELGTLLKMVGLVGAAFAGWKIGSYLSENFTSVRVVALSTVEAVLVGWVNLKTGVQTSILSIQQFFTNSGAYIQDAWNGILSYLMEAVSSWTRGLSSIFSVIPGMSGISDSLYQTSLGLGELSVSYDQASAKKVSYATQIEALKASQATEVAAIRENIGALKEYEIEQEATNNLAQTTVTSQQQLVGSSAAMGESLNQIAVNGEGANVALNGISNSVNNVAASGSGASETLSGVSSSIETVGTSGGAASETLNSVANSVSNVATSGSGASESLNNISNSVNQVASSTGAGENLNAIAISIDNVATSGSGASESLTGIASAVESVGNTGTTASESLTQVNVAAEGLSSAGQSAQSALEGIDTASQQAAKSVGVIAEAQKDASVQAKVSSEETKASFAGLANEIESQSASAGNAIQNFNDVIGQIGQGEGQISSLSTSIESLNASISSLSLNAQNASTSIDSIAKSLSSASGATSQFTGSVTAMIASAQATINVNWSSYGVQAITTLSSGVKSSQGAFTASIQSVANAAKASLSGINLAPAGRAMMMTMSSGIQSAASALKAQVSSTMASIDALMPHSDAKEGPLSNLTKSGASIPETLASGVSKRSKVLKGAVEKTMSEAQKAMFDAGQRLKEAQMTPQQIEAEKLHLKGLSEAQAGQVQSIEALADAKELLTDTEKKLSEIGKTPEQLKLEELAQRGVNSAVLEQIKVNQTAIAVAEKQHKLKNQIAYVGMNSYEKELEALRRKGASEEQINSVVELRTELEQKKNETVLKNMDKELEYLKLSKKEQEEFNVLRSFKGEYASEAQKQELLQKHELIEAQKESNKQWDSITDKAGSYFEKMIDGSMDAKDAFHSFADDMRKTWAKSMADMAKQQLQNLDFGAMFSGIGEMFSGGGGGIMEGLSSMFSGGGGGGIMDGITSLFSGGGSGAGDALGGLGSAISGLIPGAEGLTGALGSMGGPIGMGAISAGMSLLEGDTAGAAQGLATLAGSMTPLGPLGGMIASQLVSMAGIGAEWVEESRNIGGSIKGLTGDFQYFIRETKEGILGGERTRTENLGEEENSQLQGIMGQTVETIQALSDSLGQDLLPSLDNFSSFLGKTHEDSIQFEEWLADTTGDMIRNAVASIKIEGVDTDILPMMQHHISNTVGAITSGTFSKAVQKEFWSGKYPIERANEIGNALNLALGDFVAQTNFSGMSADDINQSLNQELSQLFSSMGVSLPESAIREIGESLGYQLASAVEFMDTGMGGITEDTQFFETMRGMVQVFEGDTEQVLAFVESMLGLKNSASQAGLSTNILTKEFITLSGGTGQAVEKISFYSDKFATDAQKQSVKLQSSMVTVSSVLSDLGADAPRTRSEFAALTQAMSHAGPEGAKLTQRLLESAEAFDHFYTALEKVFSIDASSIGKDLMDAVFNAESAEQAGQMMADRFAEQFYQQMVGSVMNSVAQTIFDGIVSPFLNSSAQASLNITQGGTIAGATMAEGGVISATTLSEGGAISATTMAQGGAIAGTTLSEGAAISATTLGEGGVISATTIAEGGTVAATTLNEGGIAGATNIAEGGTVAGTNVGMGGEMASASIVAGGFIAADALAAIVEDVKQKMLIMAEVMNQLKEEGVMDQIQGAMMDIGSTAYETVQTSPAVTFQKATITAPGIIAPSTDFSTATNTMANSIEKTIPTVNAVTETFKSVQPPVENVTKTLRETGPTIDEVARQTEDLAEKRRAEAQAIAEQQARTAEFNADIETQIKKMGLEGLELSLFDLSKEFENTRKSAIESGGNLAQVEKLFGLKKQEIIDGFHEEELTKQKEQNDAIQGIQNSVRQTLSGMTEFEYTISQMADKYPELTKTIVQSGVSYEQALDKIANMSETEWQEMAKANGVSVDELVSDAERAVGAFGSLNEALKQEKEVIQGLQSSILRLDSGFSDSENTIIQLAQKYPLITEAITQSGFGYQEILNSVANMTDEQLRQIAKTNGVTVEELVQDAGSVISAYTDLSETLKQEREVILGFRDSLKKMASGMTDSEYTITSLAGKYPLITNAIVQSGASYEQVIQHMTDMSETEWQEMAKANGVSVDELVSDAERAVDAFESLNETLKQESEVILGFQDSLKKMASGMSDSQHTITQLAGKYPLITNAIVQSGMSYEQVISHMANMTETEWREMARVNGVSVDELVADAEKAVGAFESLNETLEQEREVILGFQDSLKKMNSGMTDSEYTITALAGKYPLITDAIAQSGMSYEQIVNQMTNMTETEWRETAKANGVSVDEMVSDAEKAVDALESLNETLKQESQAILGLQESLKKMTSGMGDAEYTITSLAGKYPIITDAIVQSGIGYEEAIQSMANMTESEWREMAAVNGVSVEEFVADAENLASAMRTSQDEFNDWTSGLRDFTGNNNALQTFAETMPAQLGMIADAAGATFNGIRYSSEELATEILRLSTNPIEMMKVARDMGFESVDAFMGAVDTLLPALDEIEQKTAEFKTQMTDFTLSGANLTEAERQIVDLMGTFTNIDVPKFALESNLKDIASQLANASEDELLQLADNLGVSYDVLIEKAPAFLDAAQEIQDGLTQTIESIKNIGYEGADYEKTLDGLGERFGQLTQVTDYASMSFEDMRSDILGLSTDDLLGLVDTLGIGMDELQNVTQEYLDALYQFNEATSDFRDNLLSTVSKFTEDESFLQERGNTFSSFGATQAEAAQRLGTLTNKEIKDAADTLGLLPSQFMETATQYVDALGNIEGIVQSFSGSMKSMLPGYDENIETMRDLGDSYGKVLSGQFENIEDAIQGLSSLSPAQIQNLASQMDVGVTEFTENMESYVSSLNDVNSSIVDVRKDVGKSIKTLKTKLEGAGATSSERLLALQSEINLNMPFSQENLEKITEYKDLVLETMDDEIQRAKDLQDAVSKLGNLINDLKLDDNLSVLNDFEKYEEARRQYEDVKKRALGGDIEAINEVEGTLKQFLERSKQYNASGQDYLTDYNSTMGDLEQIKGLKDNTLSEADMTRQIQERQLAELERLNPIMDNMSSSLFNVGQNFNSFSIVDATVLSGEAIVDSLDQGFNAFESVGTGQEVKIDNFNNVPEVIMRNSSVNDAELKKSNALLQQQNAILKNILAQIGVNNELVEEQTEAVNNGNKEVKREVKRNRQQSSVR